MAYVPVADRGGTAQRRAGYVPVAARKGQSTLPANFRTTDGDDVYAAPPELPASVANTNSQTPQFRIGNLTVRDAAERITGTSAGSTPVATEDKLPELRDVVTTVRRIVLPTRRDILTQLQDEAGQTFTPEEAKRRILEYERETEPTILSANAGQEELDLESVPFDEFLDTRKVDLFGVGTLRRVGANLTDAVMSRLVRSSDPQAIVRELTAGGLRKDLAESIAPIVARLDEPAAVQRALSENALSLPNKVMTEFGDTRVVPRREFERVLRDPSLNTKQRSLIQRTLSEYDTRVSNVDDAGNRLDLDDRIPVQDFVANLHKHAGGLELPELPKLPKKAAESSVRRPSGQRAPKAGTARKRSPRGAQASSAADIERSTRLNRLKQRFVETHRMPQVGTGKRKSDRFLSEQSPEVRKGFNIAIDKIKERRAIIRAVQSYYGLTDAQIARLRGRADIRIMDEGEYDDFLTRLDEAAAREEELSRLRAQVKGTIHEKELKKVENLQQALNMSPSLNRLDAEELRILDEALQPFHTGDEFLSVRKLQTVDMTDLQGIKTIREARERLAEEIDVPISKLENIQVSEFDRYRWDTSLAERNPFYQLLVDGVNAAVINGEARYLRAEEQIEDLVRAARRSRNRTVGARIRSAIIPTDRRVFDYLEADPIKKGALAEDMTPEEMKLARHIENDLARRRDYLLRHGVMKRYRDNYITHIRRNFLEAVSDDGLKVALRELLAGYQLEEGVFNILDQDTANILPLEKFFQFAMRRTGQLKPSKNVARAYLSYVRTFEKKAALDSIVPKIDIYTHALTPPGLTPRGLEVDRSLKRLINEWINTKKGRTAHLFAKQGGKIDIAMRSIQAFTYLHDLALNIPVGLAAQFGEQTASYINLGARKYASGVRRLGTKKGRDVIREYRNFTGKTPWDSLHEASKGLPEKLHEGLFGLFQSATVRANRIHLLGSMTAEEWRTGQLSADRLAALRREIGRYRAVQNASSIIGSTAEGSIWRQYKSWAIPPMRTVVKNSVDLTRMLAQGDISAVRSREFQELFRATQVIALVSLAAYGVADQEDDSFIGTLRQKALQDAMSILGSLNPAVFTSVPRVMTFVDDLREGVSNLITLEQYANGELKGPRQLNRTLVPVAARQFSAPDSDAATEAAPQLSPLPDLPKFPKLPKIPSI